jgi:hypothetical protein
LLETTRGNGNAPGRRSMGVSITRGCNR